MGLRLFWIFPSFLFLIAAMAAESGTHLHRYMLSEYRAQHNARKQLDYKNQMPRTQNQEGGNTEDIKPKRYGKSKEAQVQLRMSGEKLSIHELIVRIYLDEEYACVGTQVADTLIITSSTCFDETSPSLVTMKTYSNQVIVGQIINLNDTYVRSSDPMLVAISLKSPPHDNKLKGDFVEICNTKLMEGEDVVLPLWIRSRHNIHSWNTWTLPMQECRHRIKDPSGNLARDSLICVNNEKYTTECQNTIGNPLIRNYMMCGVNVAGHNCPLFTGIVLYATIYDEHDIAMSGLKLIKKFDIDSIIL